MLYQVHCDQPWQDIGGTPQCPGTLLLDAAPWWNLSIEQGQQLLTSSALVLISAWAGVAIVRVIRSR